MFQTHSGQLKVGERKKEVTKPKSTLKPQARKNLLRAYQQAASKDGEAEEQQTEVLAEWLKDDPDLLQECINAQSDPQWWAIDAQTTPVSYRTPEEVQEIRKDPNENGGHHPHGLALGGPRGQTLTPTGETRTRKNPKHTAVTTLQRKVIRKIKNKIGEK